MRRRRRLSSVLLPVGLAGVLLGAAACGSSGGDSGAAAANSENSSFDSMTTQELAAQAAKEGSLTWYTTFADDDVQPMVAAFNKTYPNIKVNALRLSADKIPQRIKIGRASCRERAELEVDDALC